MAFISYRVTNYDITAEREQFRLLCRQLKDYYDTRNELCLFIGNVNVDGKELDGLLIKQDAVIVIEFKNYGGTVKAVENGEWTTDGGVVIKGGSFKTLLAQIRLNKAGVKRGLIERHALTEECLTHIGAIVAFNQPISLVNELSYSTNMWLRACDNEHFMDMVKDRTSKYTRLTHDEILSIPSKLGLSEKDIYEESSDIFIKDMSSINFDKEEDEEQYEQKEDNIDKDMNLTELTLDKLFVLPKDSSTLIGKTFVGIDFGTSTTVVSMASYDSKSQKIEVKTMQLGQKMSGGVQYKGDLLPTVIATDGKLYVGAGASEMKHRPQFEKGKNLWYAFKMELGMDMGPKYYQTENPLIKSPQDATRMFFKYLKREIEKYVEENGLGKQICYAVSIPASFESNQRQDLLNALQDNDMDVQGENLIDEPNAAFIGYINPDMTVKDPIVLQEGYNPKVLVFDFGAGTCDLSLLEIGANQKGYYSRNISISQFEELGGNDIDRYIAYNYIYPQLLAENNLTADTYTSGQTQKIVEQLYGVAEQLKIKVCKDLDLVGNDAEAIRLMLDHELKVSISETVNIYTDYQDLHMEEFHLSYKEFFKTMEVFMNKTVQNATKIGKQKKYNSIYAAINSALNKAHVEKSEVDYVVMIGGSSKNPYVQGIIKEYFDEGTEMLIPQDLQSLVSQGAAIHSLLLHGFNSRIIKPITSEPIVIVTSGGHEHVVIPAGTEIPFSPVVVNGLYTRKEQSIVEIPICVSNVEKVVANVKVTAPDGSCFPKDFNLPLTLSMNISKALIVSCQYYDTECTVSIENPFANTYLTDNEKAILEAERETYKSAIGNGGKPTKQSLNSLKEAYRKADMQYEAAETLEESLALYPNPAEYNTLGVLYHNSGNYAKAMKAYEKGLISYPDNAWLHANMGHDLFITGKKEEAEKHLRKAIELKPELAYACIELGELLSLDDDDEANEYYTRGYNILLRKWKNGSIDNVDKGWLASVAETLGKDEIAKEVRESLRKSKSDKFDVENLLTFKNIEK